MGNRIRPRTAAGVLAAVAAVFFIIFFFQTRTGTGAVPVSERSLPGDAAVAAGMVAPSDVTVFADGASARGSIIGSVREGLLCVTVRHLLEQPSSLADGKTACRVTLCNGKTVDAVLLASSDRCDALFILVPRESPDAKTLRLLRAVRFPDGETTYESGKEVFLNLADGTHNTGFLSGMRMETDTIGDSVFQCFIEVSPGMSGSGVFDATGTYLGMVLMGDDKDSVLALPAETVQAEAERLVYR